MFLQYIIFSWVENIIHECIFIFQSTCVLLCSLTALIYIYIYNIHMNICIYIYSIAIDLYKNSFYSYLIAYTKPILNVFLIKL